ncbi:MAG: hydrogenase expression/formation protein HypE [Treponema sp.]|uniref:hydrogenase expression/formation protein HypE n=1 Tax=Treponema sp. TaxID=166 RepID=UPI00298DBE37|nr:hydrogenase expression/formation protein HypE [Treponema sp.]MBR5933967.1 hydrogenase expression/formation protein HypE [Treponema sp.]
MDEFITLAHGAGGRQTSDLIGGLFKKYFANENLTEDDAAVVKFPPADFNNGDSAAQGNADLVMTTDGFIVSPQEFNGGNIGKLSICGTVNDLACMGAKPLYLTCAFVIEEGFPFAKLEKIAEAMGKTAKEAGVQIIAGDTKVAGKGQVDGIFITTTGVGLRLNGVKTGGSLAKPGDAVIVTGNIGQHGCCILIERNEFGINADVKSDCAPLCNSVLGLLNDTKDVHVIRDATRGGVGTVLYEIAEQSKTGIKLFQDKVPVSPEVKGVCGMLGLEPLYLACEGRLVIFAPKENAENILASLKKQKYTEDSCIIGEVVSENPGRVIVETEIGSKTMLPPPGGELLPRIC